MVTPVRPDAVPGLAFWFQTAASSVALDGAGNVQTWVDSSAGAHNAQHAASLGRPKYLVDAGDNRPAIKFDGRDDSFGGFDPLTGVLTVSGSPFSILINCQQRSFAPLGDGAAYSLGHVPFSVGMNVSNNPDFMAVYVAPRRRDAARIKYFRSGQEDAASPVARGNIAEGAWHQVLVRYPGDNTLLLRLGTDDADVTSAATGGSNGANTIRLGGLVRAGVGQGSFSGLIREVVGYSRAVTDNEWLGVLAWMQKPGPSAPPSITNVAPPPGTSIARVDPIFFDVTDDLNAFRRAIVCARFVDGTYEVVHDGDAFAQGYAALSTRTVIAGGFRYRIRRVAGWPSGPTITPFVYDTDGNENA